MLVNDGDEGDDYEEAEKVSLQYTSDSRISFFAVPKGNSWGHNCRNFGIRNNPSEWLVLTGHDNYYVPTFIESVESILDRNNHELDFIYWNMIHSYYRYNFSRPPNTPIINPGGPDPAYLPSTKINAGKIDIGAFAVRNKIAKTGKLNEERPESDWPYVARLVSYPGIRIAKITRCLYVHN